MDKDEAVDTATLPIETLRDLIDMAQQSRQYREGYAWTACAMVAATKAYAKAMLDKARRIEASLDPKEQ